MPPEARSAQETIAMAADPAAEFHALPKRKRRDAFLGMSEELQAMLVSELTRSELEAFVATLDPDEATDVLGFFVFLGIARAVLL